MKVRWLIILSFYLYSCGFQAEIQTSSDDLTSPGTISTLQSTSKGYDTFTSVASNPINTQSTTNFLVFISRQGAGDPTIITDNMGNTFTEILSSTVTNGGAFDDEIFAFSCFECSGGVGHIFTATTGVVAAPSIFVLEVESSGLLKLGASTSSAAVQTFSPVLSGSINSSAGSLLVGFATSGENGTNSIYSWNNDFVMHTEITDASYWLGSVATKKITTDSVEEVSMDTDQIIDGTALLIELTL